MAINWLEGGFPPAPPSIERTLLSNELLALGCFVVVSLRGKEFNQVDKADMTTALLAASRGNQKDIVKYILLADLSVMPENPDKLEDLTCVFEVNIYIFFFAIG